MNCYLADRKEIRDGCKSKTVYRGKGKGTDRCIFLLCRGKAAGQAWLDAAGTDQEAEKTKALIAELEEDIISIDGLIAFAGSKGGAKVFGEEKAKEVEAHAKEIKAAGAKYCDCPACSAVAAILEKKDEMLA